MRLTRWWRFGALLTAVMVIALVGSLVATVGAGPPDEDDLEEVHGRDVGNGVKQFVFVFRPRTHDGSSGPNQCVDGDQPGTLSQFAGPKPGGILLRYYRIGTPSYLAPTAAQGAVQTAFGSWDAIDTTTTYFSWQIDTANRWPGFKLDGKNAVGWKKGGGWLAAVSAWSDADGNVREADMVYNNLYGWWIFAAGCDPTAPNYFDIEGVGTHEAGHVLGKNHLSDDHQHATLYPSAYPKETKKRTITTGETQSGIP